MSTIINRDPNWRDNILNYTPPRPTSASMRLRWDHGLIIATAEAAKTVNMTRSGYMRRAVAASIHHHTGLDETILLAHSNTPFPPLKTPDTGINLNIHHCPGCTTHPA